MTYDYRKKNRKKYLSDIKKRYKKYYYKYYQKYSLEHKEQIKKRMQLYYLKHKKRINLRSSIYNKTAKGKHIQRIKSYKQRVKRLNGSHTLNEWNTLKKKFNYKCAICKKHKKLTRDHIIPLSKNGSNYIKNIQPLCQSCNSRKYNN
jgi:5-methylcytosine-specific restriction endonuclease McrA